MHKWNYEKKEYDIYNVPLDWNISLFEHDMETVINCASCGKEIPFGDCYTSKEIHTYKGMGYAICPECYDKELSRMQASIITETYKKKKASVERSQLQIELEGEVITLLNELNENDEIDYHVYSRLFDSLIDILHRAFSANKNSAPSIIDAPIEALKLSTRSYAALKRAGKTYVRELTDMTRDDYLPIKNFGNKCMKEVVDTLALHGLSIKEY